MIIIIHELTIHVWNLFIYICSFFPVEYSTTRFLYHRFTIKTARTSWFTVAPASVRKQSQTLVGQAALQCECGKPRLKRNISFKNVDVHCKK